MRLAWLYLGKYPALEALTRFVEGLKRFADVQGQPGLYHETITWAYLFLIHERIAKGADDETWDEFAARNPDLLGWNPSDPGPVLRPGDPVLGPGAEVVRDAGGSHSTHLGVLTLLCQTAHSLRLQALPSGKKPYLTGISGASRIVATARQKKSRTSWIRLPIW